MSIPASRGYYTKKGRFFGGTDKTYAISSPVLYELLCIMHRSSVRYALAAAPVPTGFLTERVLFQRTAGIRPVFMRQQTVPVPLPEHKKLESTGKTWYGTGVKIIYFRKERYDVYL